MDLTQKSEIVFLPAIPDQIPIAQLWKRGYFDALLPYRLNITGLTQLAHIVGCVSR